MPPATTWAIAAAATAGVVIRPWRSPEWAVAGAALFVLIARLPIAAAVAKGGDVYLLLTGMMLPSEAARAHGLFDRVAARVANAAHGSRPRLFLPIYATGVVVIAFLSNDATALMLTPAVYGHACRRVRRAHGHGLGRDGMNGAA